MNHFRCKVLDAMTASHDLSLVNQITRILCNLHYFSSDKNLEVARIGQKGQYFEIFTGPSDTLLALQAPKVQSIARGSGGIPLPLQKLLEFI